MPTLYTPRTKPSTSYTNRTKPTTGSAMIHQGQPIGLLMALTYANDITITAGTPSPTYTNRTKPSTSYTNRVKP